MLVFILSLLLMIVVIAIMSIGVMMGRKPIAGSCGGLKNLGDGAVCEICGGNPVRCSEQAENEAQQAGGGAPYDATRTGATPPPVAEQSRV